MDKIYKIYLDAGHGKHTTGKCTPDGISEWEMNDKVCLYVANNLAKYNAIVYRCDDTTGETDPLPVSKRLTVAEEGGADVCISIHHNITGDGSFQAGKEATGVEVFVGANYTEASKELASMILTNLVSNTQMRNRGLKTADLGMCAAKPFPTILCEGGFMNNEMDSQYIRTDKGQKAYAKAISSALIEFFKLTKNYSESALEQKQTSSEYVVSTSYDNLSNRIGVWTVLATAIAECDKHEGCKVFDSNGNVVHESILQPDTSKYKYVKVGSKDGKVMKLGQTLKMRNAPSGQTGSIITEIPYGTKLILISKTNASYWQCKTEDDKFTGYLYNGYLNEL